jgi:hypothetical protein
MSGRGKDRVVSPTPSIVLTATTATITAAAKATVLEVFKPEPFAGSRFKVFCTQIRLEIWADT